MHRQEGAIPTLKFQRMKFVDLEEPTSFLDYVYHGCTQRECKSNENIIEEYKKMFESRISAGATQKIPVWEKSHSKTVAWSHDMEGHVKKCVERYCELAESPLHAWTTISSGRSALKSSVNACIWPVLVDLIFFGSAKQTCTRCHKMDQSL